MPWIATLSLFVGVEASATWHPGLSQWRPLSGLFVDSQRLVARSQNQTKCVKYVWLNYPTWPSRWGLCISMQWLRLKGCHVACDEWTSGEICSLQHMWVIGSVMWAAASDESLKFGVQGATATNWFSRVNGARDNRIWLYRFDLVPVLLYFGQWWHKILVSHKSVTVTTCITECIYFSTFHAIWGLSSHLES